MKKALKKDARVAYGDRKGGTVTGRLGSIGRKAAPCFAALAYVPAVRRRFER
ncbi:MAG: hypothetical protein AB1666_04180 [Pseudomonadota bacterium]